MSSLVAIGLFLTVAFVIGAVIAAIEENDK